jgi:Cu/Ag efflux pump CusA
MGPLGWDGPRRLDRGPRERSAAKIGSVGGARDVTLAQVTRFERREGPAQVSRENALRRVVVEANVRGRDLGGIVTSTILTLLVLPALYALAAGTASLLTAPTTGWSRSSPG